MALNLPSRRLFLGMSRRRQVFLEQQHVHPGDAFVCPRDVTT